MSFSILNNIPSLEAENSLSITQASLQQTLVQLSTGSRINSGADDAAGLAIADGLHANEVALQQSSNNTQDGIGKLQVADGALSQVTTLLDRAITLATEAANGLVTSTQATALDNEFTKIKDEITNIGNNTTFNGSSVFNTSTTSIFISDASSNYTIIVEVNNLSAGTINGSSAAGLAVASLTADALTSASGAAGALSDINAALVNIASKRGEIGAVVNQLQAANNIINTQVQNLTSAEDNIRSANIAQVVGNLSRFNILNQTGISALAQANSSQQAVLSLLR